MSNEFFRDAQWLDAHGGLVEPHTAEEYFSGSQWYDRTCLNEQWKVQGVQPTEEVRRCVPGPAALVSAQSQLLYQPRLLTPRAPALQPLHGSRVSPSPPAASSSVRASQGAPRRWA